MPKRELEYTVVVGGGQAGLAAGYYLAQRQIPFVILDDSHRTGDVWRRRWESLRLFTPSYFNRLPGMPFPRPEDYFPTKDEVADWLEDYAAHYKLPIEHGARVERLRRDGTHFEVEIDCATISATNVIVTTGAFHSPRVPAFAADLDPKIAQIHSLDYQNPAQVKTDSVLVVGAGNSGAEIAFELAKAGKKVKLAGRDVGSIPADKLGRILGGRPYWWVLHHVITLMTPVGRKLSRNAVQHGNPLIRVLRDDLVRTGVETTGRISGTKDGKPLTETGDTLDEGTIIWATGFRPDFGWIELPIFDRFGYPRHRLGVVREAPGLFFVGLHFQSGLTSALLGGVGADAKYVTRHLRYV